LSSEQSGEWSGLVTVGANMNPGEFVAAPSVAVERFVAQADVLDPADVLDHADVMLCHGGLGSVLGAAGPEVLREAISGVLDSAAHCSACEELRDKTISMPGVDDIVEQLVALAQH
jgi:UDP:flavonoid glycosyltransferase YjiC (YdhE family)